MSYRDFTTYKQQNQEQNSRSIDYGGLYSSPSILPGISLESWNFAGLILEFDILPDCGWNIARFVFYLLHSVSPCRVPLDSVKIL